VPEGGAVGQAEAANAHVTFVGGRRVLALHLSVMTRRQAAPMEKREKLARKTGRQAQTERHDLG